MTTVKVAAALLATTTLITECRTTEDMFGPLFYPDVTTSPRPASTTMRDEPIYSHFSHNAPGCVGNNYYNTTHGLGWWCEEDSKYPSKEIETAILFHFYSVAAMYKEVVEEEEAARRPSGCYGKNLCPSSAATIRPRRAKNAKGEWRIVVNRVTAENKGSRFYMTQSARIEGCEGRGVRCPVVPDEYGSKCVQKYNHHRFLIFDPFQYYLPFAVDSFKLPSDCSCFVEAYSPNPDDGHACEERRP